MKLLLHIPQLKWLLTKSIVHAPIFVAIEVLINLLISVLTLVSS